MNNNIEDNVADWLLCLQKSQLEFLHNRKYYVVSDNSQPELNKYFYEDGLLSVRRTCSPLQAPLRSSGINID